MHNPGRSRDGRCERGPASPLSRDIFRLAQPGSLIPLGNPFCPLLFWISFIVQQMRRGFDDERLLRKRFSASLMGLRGSSSLALSAVYNGGDSAPQRRAATGQFPILGHTQEI